MTKNKQLKIKGPKEKLTLQILIQAIYLIWIKPREVCRQVLPMTSDVWMVILVVLCGVTKTVTSISSSGSVPSVLSFFGDILSNIISGLLFIYLYGLIQRLVCNALGGQISDKKIRALLVWQMVPAILLHIVTGIIVLLVNLAGAGAEFFQASTVFSVIFSLVISAVYIWWFIINCVMLSELLKFTVLRAFFVMIMTGVFVFLLSLLFSGVFTGIFMRVFTL